MEIVDSQKKTKSAENVAKNCTLNLRIEKETNSTQKSRFFIPDDIIFFLAFCAFANFNTFMHFYESRKKAFSMIEKKLI